MRGFLGLGRGFRTVKRKVDDQFRAVGSYGMEGGDQMGSKWRRLGCLVGKAFGLGMGLGADEFKQLGHLFWPNSIEYQATIFFLF